MNDSNNPAYVSSDPLPDYFLPLGSQHDSPSARELGDYLSGLIFPADEKLTSSDKNLDDVQDTSSCAPENSSSDENEKARDFNEKNYSPGNAGRFLEDTYYSDFREYRGIIEYVDEANQVFRASYRELGDQSELTSEFDIDLLPAYSEPRSLIGLSFVLIVGQKRKLFLNREGKFKSAGKENFSRLYLICEGVPSSKQRDEIDEATKRWSGLLDS